MWVKLDDGAASHPKVQLLSGAGLRVWLRGLCYAAQNLTDGKIPLEEAQGWAFAAAMRDGNHQRYGEVVQELTTVPKGFEHALWEDCGDHYAIHDWHDYQPTSDQVEAERAAARARMRNLRKGSSKGPRGGTVRPNVRANEQANVRAKFGDPVPVPVPVSVPQEDREATPPVRRPENGTPGREPQEEPVLVYPVTPTKAGGETEWGLPEAKVAEWKECFPGLDILAECRLALQWTRDNPGRRKTARGMPRFLLNWLDRAQNRRGGQNLGNGSARPGSPPRKATWRGDDRSLSDPSLATHGSDEF